MSRNGADNGEMDFSRLTTDPELAAFATALRTSLPATPPARLTSTIVPRLAEEARIGAAEAPTAAAHAARRPRRRSLLVARIAVAVAAVPLLFAGVAAAGVKLPGPVDNAFEAVGVDLPNQSPDRGGSGSSTNDGATGSGDEGTGSEGGPKAGDPGHSGSAPGKSKQGHGHRGGSGTPANENGQGHGKPAVPPGQAKPKPQTGSGNSNAGGNGKAVGKTDSAPPGQAKQPESPGKSGSAPGKNKG